MLRPLIAGGAALAALLSAQASAQATAEFSMYSQGHFKGARTSLAGPMQFAQPLVVRSISVPPGTAWDLCSGKTYTGCREYKETDAAMIMTVRSARPVAAILPASPEVRAGVARPGQSLRGVASEYFVAPGEGDSRIEVQPGTAEAMSQRANIFCRARGWRSSAHGRLQTVGGRVYLADVLCVDP